jgi:hypothetical protein
VRKCEASAREPAVPAIEEASSSEVDSLQDAVAAARKNNIGTMHEFEFPEGSLKIIDLVEIARSLGGRTMQSTEEEEEDYEDEYVNDEVENCEEVEGEFFQSDAGTVAREGTTLDRPSYASVKLATGLQIPQAIVYSGTFQDYRQESQKFCRFRTLASFARAVRHNVGEPGVSGAAPCEKKQSSIIDCVLPSQTGAPCQLVTLSTPPSAQATHAIYVALSFDTLFSFTAPEAPTENVYAATAKMGATAKAGSGPVGSCLSSQADGATKESSHAAVAGGLPGKSPYRFCFHPEDLQKLGTDGPVQPMLLKSSKLDKADDGSNWVVDDTFASASRWFSSLGQQRHRGTAVTEFISEGKVALDAGAVVALPKIPGRPPMRMCLNAVRTSRSVF